MQSLGPATLGLFLAILLSAGVGAGLLGGLLGVGGGMIIVPVLLHVFQSFAVPSAHAMHLAVGTSLATIIATSMVSTRSHARYGAIDRALVRSWAPWLVAGVVFGSTLAAFLGEPT